LPIADLDQQKHQESSYVKTFTITADIERQKIQEISDDIYDLENEASKGNDGSFHLHFFTLKICSV